MGEVYTMVGIPGCTGCTMVGVPQGVYNPGVRKGLASFASQDLGLGRVLASFASQDPKVGGEYTPVYTPMVGRWVYHSCICLPASCL